MVFQFKSRLFSFTQRELWFFVQNNRSRTTITRTKKKINVCLGRQSLNDGKAAVFPFLFFFFIKVTCKVLASKRKIRNMEEISSHHIKESMYIFTPFKRKKNEFVFEVRITV